MAKRRNLPAAGREGKERQLKHRQDFLLQKIAAEPPGTQLHRDFISNKMGLTGLTLCIPVLLCRPGYSVLSSCSCILLIRSSSFSDERSSRILSTLMGKQNGVSFSGNARMIRDC